MTRASVDVFTEAPTLRITADLGDQPSLKTVTAYLEALDELCRLALNSLLPIPDRTRTGADRYTVVNPFGVVRLQMGSPLEVAIATVESMAPAAYALVAMRLVERSLTLVMKWQKHRAELTLNPHASPLEKRVLDEPEHLSDEKGQTIQRMLKIAPPDVEERQALRDALNVLKEHEILYVETNLQDP